MSVIGSINRMLNAKSTGAALFALTGGYKLVSDYKKAPKEDKKSVLFRDSVILGGSALGIIGYTRWRADFAKSPFKQKSYEKINQAWQDLKKTKVFNGIKGIFSETAKTHIKQAGEHAYNVTKDCVDSTATVGSGIVGAIAADYLIQLGHFHKNIMNIKTANKIENSIEKIKTEENTEEKEQPKENKTVNTENSLPETSFDKFKRKVMNNSLTGDIKQMGDIVGEDAKNNILSNITNMPEMKMFTSSMIGLQGLEIAEEKTFKKKLKHTVRNLLTNTLIPIFYLSLASNITKGMKSVYRVPLAFTSMVVGTMFTNRKINSKVLND